MAKYIHKFDNAFDFEDVYFGEDYDTPWVSLIHTDNDNSYFDNTLFYNKYRPNGYDYVDLGLPSGNMWATCNVGAENPEDEGDYFSWAEVSPKSDYSWNTLKYYHNSNPIYFTKYSWDSSYPCDYLDTLEKKDDAACVNMKGSWSMPNIDDYDELKDYTTQTYVEVNGQHCMKFTSANGNYIIFPGSGWLQDTVKEYYDEGYSTALWMNHVYVSSDEYAQYFSIKMCNYVNGHVVYGVVGDIVDDINLRNQGLQVRGVMKPPSRIILK